MKNTSIPADEVRFFSGSSNPKLAEDIASKLGVPLDATHISRFSNDDLYIQLGASVRYRRVYIVQSLSKPVNDHLMELLMMIDIARGAAASEIHAIIPYYSFGRSDKKDAPRISITARLVAGGLDPSTPAILVERGTTPAQRVWRSRLADIGGAATDVQPPALLLVGAVAGHALQGRRPPWDG